MRGKKAIINTIFCMLEEIAAVISAFILPKLILEAFGSKYNGLLTSITQFLACAVLLRCGIGGATRAALYKALVKKDNEEISAIVNATNKFMKKIGFILASLIIVFSLTYPFLVQKEFDWLFTCSLFLIIGASTFAESFFGITYLIVLQSDQKIGIASLFKTLCYIINIILVFVTVKMGLGIRSVKIVSSLIYIVYPIVLQMYVVKKYNINRNIPPKMETISQRWDAFWHQFSSFVMSNTDVIVLTIFTNMLEVSVYSVYSLVVNGLKKFIVTFSNSLEGAFGEMIAKDEKKLVKDNFKIIEQLIFIISTLVYSVATIMIIDFVKIYTKGVNDANYIRPVFAIILMIAQFFSCIRIPYQIVVQAAGHYRQTKKGAIIEPILNIIISIILSIKFGLIGVVIGTLVATIYRTLQYSIYMSKNLINIKYQLIFKRISISVIEMSICILIGFKIDFIVVNNYFNWIGKAILSTFFVSVVIVLFEVMLFKNDSLLMAKKIMKSIRKEKI